jgi:hypothetical protein
VLLALRKMQKPMKKKASAKANEKKPKRSASCVHTFQPARPNPLRRVPRRREARDR